MAMRMITPWKNPEARIFGCDAVYRPTSSTSWEGGGKSNWAPPTSNDQHGAIDFIENRAGDRGLPAAVRTGSRPAMCRALYLTSRNHGPRLTSALGKERSSAHSSAIDPPLSRRLTYASCSLQNHFRLQYESRPSTDQFVWCFGLKKQSAMVHKRPPVAGDSPTAAD
jgi:hypothetical protein